MGLNESKGNMYEFVTHTWNTVKGQCPHDCSYCYMKRWGKQSDLHFERRELRTDLGSGNFIFVGSSCDIFAEEVNENWVAETLEKCRQHDNAYLFQSKDPEGMHYHSNFFPNNSRLCTTIETNRWYPEIMAKSPRSEQRAKWMNELKGFERYVTIEPILDFDLFPMLELLELCEPVQVNIGADSGQNGLPEPHFEKVLELVERLKGFTTIAKKKNLDRLGNLTTGST